MHVVSKLADAVFQHTFTYFSDINFTFEGHQHCMLKHIAAKRIEEQVSFGENFIKSASILLGILDIGFH